MICSITEVISYLTLAKVNIPLCHLEQILKRKITYMLNDEKKSAKNKRKLFFLGSKIHTIQLWTARKTYIIYDSPAKIF